MFSKPFGPAYYLYVMRSNGFYKIGISRNAEKRRAELQTGNPHYIESIVKINCLYERNARWLEESLHRYFQRKRYNGEWYKDITLEEFSNAVQFILAQLDDVKYAEFKQSVQKMDLRHWPKTFKNIAEAHAHYNFRRNL